MVWISSLSNTELQFAPPLKTKQAKNKQGEIQIARYGALRMD
jgi:hypothetical protein